MTSSHLLPPRLNLFRQRLGPLPTTVAGFNKGMRYNCLPITWRMDIPLVRENARAFPAWDAWRNPPVGTRSGRRVPQDPRLRLKKRVEMKKIRLGMCNVGSMTGRGSEIADDMRKKV